MNAPFKAPTVREFISQNPTLTALEIAEVFNISPKRVRDIAARGGATKVILPRDKVRNKVWTDEMEVTLRALLADGKSARDIADALGNVVTRNAVIGKIGRLGLSIPRVPGQKMVNNPRGVNGIRKKKRPAFKSSPLPPPRVDDVARLSIMETTAATCMYPVGEVGKPGFGYCGLTKLEGDKSYCPSHHHVCWVKPVRVSRPKYYRDMTA